MQIIWHNNTCPPEYLPLVEEELQDLLDSGLESPACLIFHRIFFEDDMEVLVWGEGGCPYFHAEYFLERSKQRSRETLAKRIEDEYKWLNFGEMVDRTGSQQ